jgi:hypothetical protein
MVHHLDLLNEVEAAPPESTGCPGDIHFTMAKCWPGIIEENHVLRLAAYLSHAPLHRAKKRKMCCGNVPKQYGKENKVTC